MLIRRQVLKICLNAISLFGIALFLCLLIVPLGASAQEVVETSGILTDDYGDDASEDLVLAVYADREKLSSGVFAVQQNARYYLPIAALSDVFGFSVDVDIERRMAEGWTMSEKDVFSIDASTGKVVFQGQSVNLPAEAFLDANIAGDDIYILLEIFNQIWPLTLDVNLSSLVLRANPDGSLPYQRLLERKQRQEKLLAAQELAILQEKEPLPFVAYPYQLYGKPSLDISTTVGYDAVRNNPEYKTTLGGVQDLAYASADYSLTLAQRGGTFDAPDNVRLRFRRQNIHEGALPFGLEDTQWGDVRLKNRELIAGGASGRGFIFSTKRNSFNSEFDLITVEGNATPDWEVELYINDELIDFGVVAADGLYRFEDVSIGFGNNRVKTVLYGPQGEIREKTENYFYQSNMVKVGENQFSGGIVDQNKDFIPWDVRDTARVEGLAANIYGARGITDKVTMFASANTLYDKVGQDDVSKKYGTIGVIGAFNNTLAQAEIYKQFDGGQAIDLRTLSDFKGFKVNTQTALYDDFESPDAQDGSNAKDFEFDIDIKRIFPTVIGALGLEFGADYLRRKDGRTNTTYRTRQSLAVKGTRFTNTTRTTLSDNSHLTTINRLSSTTRMREWLLRNTLNYQTFPDISGTSFQTELRYGRNRKYSGAVSLQKNFDNQETLLGLQFSRDFKKFLGSVDADWSSRDGSSLMLRASTAFGPYAPDGSYIMQSDPLRNAGPISAFVYRDLDYDGLYSEGDEPEPNTRIAVGRRVNREETDESGYVAEMNSFVNAAIDVSANSSSIDDPYLIPANPGYSLYPRPGVMHAVQLPLIETGAIDGTLRWNTGKPIAGLLLELMNAKGDIVKKSKTAPDGYFTFERMRPDNYTIRAAPETGMNIPFKYVDLTPDNLFQFGIDITATNLSQGTDVDLGFGIADDGVMKVKNILSIAKGAKSKKGAGLTKARATAPLVAPIKKGTTQKKVIENQASTAPSDVTGVRIGEHPDKIRIVLDLSAKTSYTLDYDPKSNSIFIEMPYASWSAKKEWKSTKPSIVNQYHVEAVGSGIRFILEVDEGASVGASGLLSADKGKKDRLYIDIERK
jgi:hypothetical protein